MTDSRLPTPKQPPVSFGYPLSRLSPTIRSVYVPSSPSISLFIFPPLPSFSLLSLSSWIAIQESVEISTDAKLYKNLPYLRQAGQNLPWAARVSLRVIIWGGGVEVWTAILATTRYFHFLFLEHPFAIVSLSGPTKYTKQTLTHARECAHAQTQIPHKNIQKGRCFSGTSSANSNIEKTSPLFLPTSSSAL